MESGSFITRFVDGDTAITFHYFQKRIADYGREIIDKMTSHSRPITTGLSIMSFEFLVLKNMRE
jgi:hypothetical protein